MNSPSSSTVGHKIVAYSNAPQLRDFMKEQIFGTIPPLTGSVIPRLEGLDRTIIITGANSGLGLEAAKQFVQLLGVKRLILACRDTVKGGKARDAILATHGSHYDKTDVRVWELDMASRASISAFARRIESELDRVDAVILNAGVDLTIFDKTDASNGGYEMTLMVNVIGTIVLASLLVPILRKKKPKPIPRITIVGSSVQFAVNYQVVVDAANSDAGGGMLAWLSDESKWEGQFAKGRYFLSKGLVQMLVIQLAKKISESQANADGSHVVLNCVNPGWCRTPLFKQSATLGSRTALRLIGSEPEVGARALVIGATGVEGGTKSHGKYMSGGLVKPYCSWFDTEQGTIVAGRLWNEVSKEVEATCPGTLDAL